MGTFKMARRLIREEGLLCGGSSGIGIFLKLPLLRRVMADLTFLYTLLTADILSGKNVRAWVSIDFT